VVPPSRLPSDAVVLGRTLPVGGPVDPGDTAPFRLSRSRCRLRNRIDRALAEPARLPDVGHRRVSDGPPGRRIARASGGSSGRPASGERGPDSLPAGRVRLRDRYGVLSLDPPAPPRTVRQGDRASRPNGRRSTPHLDPPRGPHRGGPPAPTLPRRDRFGVRAVVRVCRGPLARLGLTGGLEGLPEESGPMLRPLAPTSGTPTSAALGSAGRGRTSGALPGRAAGLGAPRRDSVRARRDSNPGLRLRRPP
jgi:hypothetical protein